MIYNFANKKISARFKFSQQKKSLIHRHLANFLTKRRILFRPTRVVLSLNCSQMIVYCHCKQHVDYFYNNKNLIKSYIVKNVKLRFCPTIQFKVDEEYIDDFNLEKMLYNLNIEH